MEVIIGIYDNKLSFEQNVEGKYNIMITRREGNRYRTGFLFDSIKLFNENQLCVSQTDDRGNKKYGLIVVSLYEIYLPCIFDKIKPFEKKVLQAFIGEEEFMIDRSGRVYSREFWNLRNPQTEDVKGVK